ncbi:MAG: 2-oxoglutarate dehydrogenase E1 component [Lentisphaerae bacterium]|nr:2-oxoglutarate dehydrogenase E1 component [Lentisphaerota bacterium]
MSADLYPSNLPYVEELYRLWSGNPAAVPPDWREYFEGLNRNAGTPHLAAPSAPVQAENMAAALHVYKQSRVSELLWAYREIGYLQADLNPLRGYVTPGMAKLRDSVGGDYRELSLGEFDLSEDDLNVEFSAGKYLSPPRAPLSRIIESVRETYCSAMGVEILHIQNRSMRNWLIENIETGNNHPHLETATRRAILEDLIKAEEFEHFLHSQFVGQKRFSLEGSESLIPALHALIDRSAYEADVEEIVLGMTHRGRLNVLVNLLGRSPSGIFATFGSDEMPFAYTGSGDVRYHLGFSVDHVNPDGSHIHVGLVANPSHLEAVDPIVEGKARGIQRRRRDTERKKVIPILIHGDAAFTGQGVVAETFNMSQLKGYRTGGTIHIIVNNQIGFTTASRDARSTFFPTDVAKSMPIPIFHVNGDKPEYVVRAMDLAFRFRQEFAYDAVVDIFCYRKYGHNEADDPTFTHPVMYEMIRQLPSVATQYGEELDREGVYPRSEQDAFREAYRNELRAALAAAEKQPPVTVDAGFQSDEWRGFTREYDHTPVETGVPDERLYPLAQAVTRMPAEIPFNPKLKRIIADRRQRYDQRANIDWTCAEALAFATLLTEGTPIRLSGEDSGRGTFAQRHAVWWYTDKEKPTPYCPFDHLSPDQARFAVYDSPLSEYSVLGFEYGNSLAQPHMLNIWEAQFGDFANGAQVVIDQFIAAAESKWDRGSGLVLLLPHGYSGQGPEHSSAHLERYLQLCAENNMQVCNMTTPAQYFHVLRRQMRRTFRKPLVIMAPKSLLRHKRAVSRFGEFTSGNFSEVLDDAQDLDQADVMLFCSGQVYYDLLQARENRHDNRTAIIRVEQLYPFPEQQLQRVLGKYAHVRAFSWVQEESRNRGAWSFIHERINALLGGRPLRYVGRKASASPATGSYSMHQRELQALLDEAFDHGEIPRSPI